MLQVWLLFSAFYSKMPHSLYAAAPSQSAVGMYSQESRVSDGIDSECGEVDHLTGS